MTTNAALEKPESVMVEDCDKIVVEDTERASQIRVIENIRVLGISDQDAEFYSNYTAAQRKKIVRKVDIRLIPMLAVLYLISQLDRANIGNAKIEGLKQDLRLTDLQYNIVLSLFFIPYILLEIPSNMLLKRFTRPSIYIGTLVTIWGIIMTLHGVTQGFGGLLAVRILLGVFEAGFYPGAVYLCTFWYMPKQLATRIAYFYCTSALSGAFSGLLAAAIAQMDGIGGYEGWRWIFILEGLVTVALGVSCYFFLIDSPSLSTRWLNPDEIRFLELQHFIKQGGRFSGETVEGRFNWRDLKAVITNWRLYLQAYILLCISACSYGIKFSLPSIVKAMGFSNTNAQLMTVPAYVAGGISSIVFATLSDHFHWRMPFVATPLALITVGFAIVMSFKGDLSGSHIGPGYFALVLACMGIYPVQPAASSWAANNLAPSSKRAVGVAFNICVGNMGGIVGSYMYLDREAPTYETGYGLSLAFGASGMLAAFLLEFSYHWANRRRAQVNQEELRARYTEDDLIRMGDKSPLFKYVL